MWWNILLAASTLVSFVPQQDSCYDPSVWETACARALPSPNSPLNIALLKGCWCARTEHAFAHTIFLQGSWSGMYSRNHGEEENYLGIPRDTSWNLVAKSISIANRRSLVAWCPGIMGYTQCCKRSIQSFRRVAVTARLSEAKVAQTKRISGISMNLLTPKVGGSYILEQTVMTMILSLVYRNIPRKGEIFVCRG